MTRRIPPPRNKSGDFEKKGTVKAILICLEALLNTKYYLTGVAIGFPGTWGPGGEGGGGVLYLIGSKQCSFSALHADIAEKKHIAVKLKPQSYTRYFFSSPLLSSPPYANKKSFHILIFVHDYLSPLTSNHLSLRIQKSLPITIQEEREMDFFDGDVRSHERNQFLRGWSVGEKGGAPGLRRRGGKGRKEVFFFFLGFVFLGGGGWDLGFGIVLWGLRVLKDLDWDGDGREK